jgi:DNA adenine methylase
MTVSERKSLLQEKYKLSPVLADRLLSEISAKDFYIKVDDYLKEKPKPFVKWVGGKRQLLSQFKDLRLYPPQEFNYARNTYYEPFVGGGAVFFDMLPKKAVLSDSNTELVTTYNIIKNDVDSLIGLLNSDYYIYDKERYLEIRALPQKKRVLSNLEVAARFIYLNRTCFNGMYRVNQSGHFNVPFGRYNSPQICDEVNLKNVSKSLKKITIINEGYEKVLTKAKPGDFVYFDPPYYPVSKTASFTSYTSGVFLEKEQEALRDTFLELNDRGCFVMLSNSDTPFIKGLFTPYQKDGVTIHKVQAGRSINSNANKRGKVFEVVVTNY